MYLNLNINNLLKSINLIKINNTNKKSPKKNINNSFISTSLSISHYK